MQQQKPKRKFMRHSESEGQINIQRRPIGNDRSEMKISQQTHRSLNRKFSQTRQQGIENKLFLKTVITTLAFIIQNDSSIFVIITSKKMSDHDHSFLNHQQTCLICDRPIILEVAIKPYDRRRNEEALKKLAQDSPSTCVSITEGQKWVDYGILDKEQDNNGFGSPEDLPQDHNSTIQIESLEPIPRLNISPLLNALEKIQEEEQEERKPKGKAGAPRKIGTKLKNYYPDMWRWIRKHTHDHSLMPNSSSFKTFPSLIENYRQEAYEYLTIEANRAIPQAISKPDKEKTNHNKKIHYRIKSQQLLDKYFGKSALPL